MLTLEGIYPECLLRFSSQYGGELACSYVLRNALGPPAIFPKYGDFTQAAVLRTYGPWWDKAPSHNSTFDRHLLSRRRKWQHEDFVTVLFRTAPEDQFLTKLGIYETYHTGAIVAIYGARGISAGDAAVDTILDSDWYLLWEEDENVERVDGLQSRLFEPLLQPVPHHINIITLVFNSQPCGYYTEIDAIQARYSKENISHQRPDSKLPSYDEVMSLPGFYRPVSAEPSDTNPLAMLPLELLFAILSLLDFRALMSVGATSRALANGVSSYLFSVHSLDLKDYWHRLNSPALVSLGERIDCLTELRLSWCGSMGLVDTAAFSSFILSTGSESLAVLHLSCCDVLTNELLEQICTHCPSLTDLDLSGCRRLSVITPVAALTSLTRLNLYRTQVDDEGLHPIIRSCTALQHLNLGSCTLVKSYDDIMDTLSQSCLELRSLDVWRSSSLTEVGLTKLVRTCTNIEELDLGWCQSLRSETLFSILAPQLPNLKKIFLTANRMVRSRDLQLLADNCPLLEQIDLLGTSLIKPDSVQYLLDRCPNLIFVDVSFCMEISNEVIEFLSQAYPQCHFMKSFQSAE